MQHKGICIARFLTSHGPGGAHKHAAAHTVSLSIFKQLKSKQKAKQSHSGAQLHSQSSLSEGTAAGTACSIAALHALV